MMTKRIDRKIQLTAYWTIILLGAGWIMFKGGFIFLPLIFAFFLAVLLSPVAEFFGKYIKARWISISLAYIVCFVPLILLFYLFALQVVDIAFNLPNIGKSLSMEIHDIYMSIRKHFRVLPSNEVTFLKDNMESLVSGPIAFLGKGIISSSSTLLSLGLAFVFAFFFLLYDRKIVYAINTNFSRKEGNFIETLEKIKYTVKAYVLGLGKVILILSVLNSVGLYLIGLEYAVFFGTLAGLLAIIPFIGTTLGALLPFLYSMATYEDPWQPAIVVIYYIIIQQLEGNVITPKIIGDEVDVNPLVAIISMLFFGAFWGIPGVILSIPLISIVKIILEGFKNTHCIAWLIGSNFNGKEE
ncbi:MAG: AI-2E family transporter [Saprospiraceae bacterium]|nr:AI-2E family transporter [Saprospiraceae bacterium]